MNKIDKWLSEYKTSWKYLKRKGYSDAEEDGDCVFINAYNTNAIEELRKILVEIIEHHHKEVGDIVHLDKLKEEIEGKKLDG